MSFGRRLWLKARHGVNKEFALKTDGRSVGQGGYVVLPLTVRETPAIPMETVETTEQAQAMSREKQTTTRMTGRAENGDRIAIVTGAGTGIGRAIAVRLARDGVRVALWGRREGPLRETAESIAPGASHVCPLDIRDPAAIEGAVAALPWGDGRVDVLVNNAGVSGVRPAGERGDDVWDDVLATNLSGSYYACRAVIPRLPDGPRSRIVMISSVLGKFGVPGYAAYCSSKHGLIGLTRALAMELAPRRIPVNAVCPGWVETDMAATGIARMAADMGVDPAEAKRRALERVPLGRFVEPEEVADLVAYLCSPAASAMTGQAINLSAGAVWW